MRPHLVEKTEARNDAVVEVDELGSVSLSMSIFIGIPLLRGRGSDSDQEYPPASPSSPANSSISARVGAESESWTPGQRQAETTGASPSTLGATSLLI
jgi:hypothetical protein